MDINSCELDMVQMASIVDEDTFLVACGAASNATGTINNVAEAACLARAVGAYSFIDAVHFAPHALVDVKAWDVDFLVCSAYKFFGPHLGKQRACKSNGPCLTWIR